MASEEAIRLKAQWMEMPTEFFETMTFGELIPGHQFISLPLPGDDDGAGGFKGMHVIFTKITDSVSDLPYDYHGRAVNYRGIQSDFPDSMPVILLI